MMERKNCWGGAFCVDNSSSFWLKCLGMKCPYGFCALKTEHERTWRMRTWKPTIFFPVCYKGSSTNRQCYESSLGTFFMRKIIQSFLVCLHAKGKSPSRHVSHSIDHWGRYIPANFFWIGTANLQFCWLVIHYTLTLEARSQTQKAIQTMN